jgi:carbon storage regulator
VGVLVLTRRTNQSIVIGSDVIITIVEIRGEQVRLGISAPRHVSVYREEVLEQIRDQNRKAAELVGNDASLLPRRSVAPAGGEPVAPSAARPARAKR